MIKPMLFLAQYEMDMNSGQVGAAEMTMMIVIVLVALVVSLGISAVICAILAGIVKRIPAGHRRVEPGSVWLLMIPCFNLYWVFPLFQRIPESFKSYFDAQGGRPQYGDCGKQLGLWYAIAVVCSVVPILNYLTGPAALVLLILLLVKWSDYKNQLPAATA
jgi:hypothetical protein